MEPDSPDPRLSRISTLWTLVNQAHHGPADAAGAAQRLLLERYAAVVHRYLGGALRDDDAADELFQEFCLRFLRGDFRRADPERGRFRDLLKTALYHLVVDYHRRPRLLPALGALTQPRSPEPAWTPPALADAEREFLERWREELMNRAWRGLAEIECKTGQPCHTVLRLRTERPALSSADLAGQLGERLGKPFTVHGLRQALHRAREKFTDLLVAEVAASLADPSAEHLEEELTDLGWRAYCGAALKRRRA